ncbi:receptor kinase-like protein Xa21 [Zingiber officinale]|uniref:receptor kinase-like protein Xa21 n=1 Tax=Zingiber officinale TaxID=94328 RepID=UPI001C4D0843|nr:receptor kinase-like protein Xa21 [Zingiber officinale]
MSSWGNTSLHSCQWRGVACTDVNGQKRVTALKLDSLQLAGKLSPSLAGLAFLNDLDLSSNAFYGPIPRELKNLSVVSPYVAIVSRDIPKSLGLLHNLDALILRNNKLEAKNAAEWLFLDGLTNCTPLRVLILENNYLGGALPKSVANLSKFLVTLSLSDNYITGCILAEIGRLVNLSRVDMSSSLLGGAIPASLGNLVKLVEIDPSRNLLAGEIPGSVGNITGLTSLILASNKLNGSVPSCLGKCRLARLNLAANRSTGAVPKEIHSISSLHNSQCFTQLANGPLPPEIGYLINLQTVDVSYNQLTGGIPATIAQSTILSGNVPDFLGSFTMTYLNLSFNDLQGELPKHGIFSNLIAFSVVGNKDLCGGIPELEEVFFFQLRIKGSYRKVSFAELHAATDGFTPANLVGKGSFGSVYKGLVDWEENKEVAVKVFNLKHNLKQKGALRSFTTECEALRSIRHRNVVKVLTACSSVDFQGNDFKALVFEFIPNGSLGKWLHPEVDEQSALRMLSFSQRLNISIDIANVLEYLHFHDPTPVVHCDLKPANVLLDHNMVAHIGDFGLARFHSATAETRAETFTSSLILKGTIGYAAPEYGLTNKVSVQGDVYMYGILLLEMFSGKKPIDEAFAEGLNLHKYVESALPEQVVKIMDPMLLLEWKGETHRIDSSTKEFRMKAIERVTSVLKSWRFVFNGVARRANEDGRYGQRASHHQGCISWVLFGMTDSKNVPVTKVVNNMQIVVKVHDSPPPSPFLLYLKINK